MDSEFTWKRPDWYDRAACVNADPKLFYPDEFSKVYAPARRICELCPVQRQCLDYAIENEPYGIWGGLSARSRQRIRFRRRRDMN